MVEMASFGYELKKTPELSPSGITYENEAYIQSNLIASDPETYFKEHPEESEADFWRDQFIREFKLDFRIKKKVLEVVRQTVSRIKFNGNLDASIEAIMKNILNSSKGGTTYLPGRRMNQHGN